MKRRYCLAVAAVALLAAIAHRLEPVHAQSGCDYIIPSTIPQVAGSGDLLVYRNGVLGTEGIDYVLSGAAVRPLWFSTGDLMSLVYVASIGTWPVTPTYSIKRLNWVCP